MRKMVAAGLALCGVLACAPARADWVPAFKGNDTGGIIASGWHTVGLAMRLFVDYYLSKVASLASPGVDEIRWPNPVRPGDTLLLLLLLPR